MTRHTTFKFCLDPTVEQRDVLSRHAGASRFAFNQCLRLVKNALDQRGTDPNTDVPWSGFDLINGFNRWKKTEDAGRLLVVDSHGCAEVIVTGLAWRREVCQQVFEESAVDCGRALAAWSDSRNGGRTGRRIRFPTFKSKGRCTQSFRVRNKHSKTGKPAIRVGDDGRQRSVTLPGIGIVAVHDDTRRLRRMLAKGRAKILFATVRNQAGRWWVSINVEAADMHRSHRHMERKESDHGGWIGVDRGLSTFLVAASADGREVARITDAPKPLSTAIRQERRLAKKLSRKQKGSHNRRQVAARLARHHGRVRNVRHHFLHQVSNRLVKTHDRLAIEDLNVAGMLRNNRLAQSISDAGWAELARQLRYKQQWRSGEIATVDRWYPSSQVCARCHTRNRHLTLADRVFTCECGYSVDRDLNAAINLAQWAENACVEPRTPKHGGRATNARRRDGADQHPGCAGETSPEDAGTDVRAAPAA